MAGGELEVAEVGGGSRVRWLASTRVHAFVLEFVGAESWP